MKFVRPKAPSWSLVEFDTRRLKLEKKRLRVTEGDRSGEQMFAVAKLRIDPGLGTQRKYSLAPSRNTCP